MVIVLDISVIDSTPVLKLIFFLLTMWIGFELHEYTIIATKANAKHIWNQTPRRYNNDNTILAQFSNTSHHNIINGLSVTRCHRERLWFLQSVGWFRIIASSMTVLSYLLTTFKKYITSKLVTNAATLHIYWFIKTSSVDIGYFC